MGSRFPSHQLSNGLYVSGHPEQPKERTPTMSSVAVPYTGGDVKKSGELGKMFDIPVDGSKCKKSGPIFNASLRCGSLAKGASHSGPINISSTVRSGYSTSGPISSLSVAGSTLITKSYSGPLSKHGEPIKRTSGPQSGGATPAGCQSSGHQSPNLPTTGLITSGPLSSSALPRKVSGPLDSSGPIKLHGSSVSNNQAVTILGQDDGYSFRRSLPRPIVWAVILLFVMGFIAGGFFLGAVHNAVLLLIVIGLFCIFAALFTWNSCWGKSAVIGYIAGYADSELRTAKNGQYIKVSGVVTCGNVPLKSSFQKVPRCVYTSTNLYEYREWHEKAPNPTHHRFTWGLIASEKHAVDFYISDFQSGLRALVKAGHGTRVIPYVDETVSMEIDPRKREPSPEFIQWLGERKLLCGDRPMRLKEGYIKEGSTISIMGVVQRNENMLMIVAPEEPFTTGCLWTKCIFPASFDGIVMWCEDTSKEDVIPV